MSVEIRNFLEAAALAARQVGIMARRLQGQVANEGKDEAGHPNDDERRRAVRNAKTAVDEIAQDILITALAPHLPVDNTLLDGEEETPGKALLSATSGDYVLVLDPIDGTLNYVEGGDGYSVNIGLLHQGTLAAALMYYPALDVAYWTPGTGAYRARQFAAHGMALAEPVSCAADPAAKDSIFVYHDIDQAIWEKLRAAGFNTLRTFRTAPGKDPVAGMFDGVVSAAVLEHVQVRDIIHAAILSCTDGAFLQDWQGNSVRWPARGGAMPKCVISGWELPQKLRDVLYCCAT